MQLAEVLVVDVGATVAPLFSDAARKAVIERLQRFMLVCSIHFAAHGFQLPGSAGAFYFPSCQPRQQARPAGDKSKKNIPMAALIKMGSEGTSNASYEELVVGPVTTIDVDGPELMRKPLVADGRSRGGF